MTTPNQDAPDGAVTISGNPWRYGQNMNEQYARSLFEIEAPSNLSEALELLPSVLAMMPTDSMKPWQKWLGATDEERSNGTLRQKIVDALSKNRLTKNEENNQIIIDGVDGGVNGGSPTGAAAGTVRDNLQKAWANIWDGLRGTTGATSKLPSEVREQAALLNGRTTVADGKGQTANNNLQTTWDLFDQGVNGGAAQQTPITKLKTNLQLAWANIWDGLGGTDGTTAKLPSDVKARAGILRGLVTEASTTATTAQNTAGGVRTDHNGLLDGVSTTFWGEGTLTNTNLADAITAMRKVQKDLSDNIKSVQDLQTKRDGTQSKGYTYVVNFGDYATMNAAGFTTTQTGSMTSQIVINNGVAQWNIVDNNNSTAKIIYKDATGTNYQAVRGTMSAPPQPPALGGQTPYFYALARVSQDGLNYVWARAFATSLGVYKADVGYAVNGVETVWASNIPLTWSLDMRFVAGVGTDPRSYQIWSGNTVVWVWSEARRDVTTANPLGRYDSISGNTWKISRGAATAGTFTLTFQGATTTALSYNATGLQVRDALTALGKGTWTLTGGTPVTGGPWYLNPPETSLSGAPVAESEILTGTGSLTGGTLVLSQDLHRDWGAIAQLRSGRHSGKVAGASAVDNGTPKVFGTTARMSRTSSSLETFVGGNAAVPLPGSFFDFADYESFDLDAYPAGGYILIGTPQTYLISGRVQLAQNIVGVGHLVLQKSSNFGVSWTTVQFGPLVTLNAGDSITGTYPSLTGDWIQYLNTNDMVRLATIRPGTNVNNALVGESSGAKSYFAITGVQ